MLADYHRASTEFSKGYGPPGFHPGKPLDLEGFRKGYGNGGNGASNGANAFPELDFDQVPGSSYLPFNGNVRENCKTFRRSLFKKNIVSLLIAYKCKIAHIFMVASQFHNKSF